MRLNHSTFRNKVDWVWLVRHLKHPDLRFHDLRGSAIVEWLRAGVPHHVAMTMVGHASLTITVVYVRMSKNELQGVAALLDARDSPCS